MADASSLGGPVRALILGIAVASGCETWTPTAPTKAAPAPSGVPVKAAAAEPERMPVALRPEAPDHVVHAPAEAVKPAAPSPGPVEPEWRALLAEADAFNSSGKVANFALGAASQARAFAAIRALPEDDPRFVEAQCILAQRGHVGAEVEAALLAALARLYAHPPADKYALLDRDDLMVTTISAMFLDDGTVQMNPHTGLNSFNWCAQADVALLKMMLIDSYETYGMYRRMYTDVPPPNVPDAFRAASQTLLEFHAELVREYGAKHARPAALVERMYWACHWSHRKQHPRICYREEEAHRTFEQALVAREATYGEDHPLTRASLLRVGVVRLAEGKVDQARTLLMRASAGEVDTPSKANAAAILGVLALQAGETDEGLALLARVEAGSDRIYGDDHWTRRQMLQLVASALQAARRYPEALRVFRRFIASHPAPQPGSPPPTWPGYAELLAAAGEHAEAIAEYDRRVEEAIALEQTGANELARQKGREARLEELRARAELRRTTGDVRGMEADLSQVQAIERGPPVAPDR